MICYVNELLSDECTFFVAGKSAAYYKGLQARRKL